MGKYIIHSTLRPIGSQVVNKLGMFSFLSDEPVAAKGTDSAPNPVQYLLAAVGSCMGATARDIENHEPSLEIKSFNTDVYGETTTYDDGSSKVTHITIKIKAQTNLDPVDHQTFLHEVIRMCTVHSSLEGSVPMDIEFVE